MFTRLRETLLKAAQSAIREFDCPKCGHHFKPFADRPATSWSELRAGLVCPACRHTFTFSDVQKNEAGQPNGPVEQPSHSRIERRPVSERELLFYIPASGKWRGWLFFAIFWNAISWPIFIAFCLSRFRENGEWLPLLFIWIFPAMGVGMAYLAIRTRFATHLLYLSPELVRLQRSLFRKSNHDVPSAEINAVRRVEFYRQNYRPVHGIEIAAGKRRIRFGSALAEDEENWLCWEIREFLRSNGALLTSGESFQ